MIWCCMVSYHISYHMGTSCLGYELSWVRVVLGTSCPGYELSWVRVVQIPLRCFFDLLLNKRLIKQSRRPWFETPLRWLWRHCNGLISICWYESPHVAIYIISPTRIYSCTINTIFQHPISWRLLIKFDMLTSYDKNLNLNHLIEHIWQ